MKLVIRIPQATQQTVSSVIVYLHWLASLAFNAPPENSGGATKRLTTKGTYLPGHL